jgi:methionyl-tRNA formyltransferase
MARLRLVFLGTPDLAATCLARLLQVPDFEVLAAVSQPDRPQGRGLHLHPTPVKLTALNAGLTVLQPLKASDPEFLQTLRRLQPDLIAVAAYGQILPRELLDLPRHGCLNVHTSLLPRYRGAAPIQWAILNGDPETGVTIMRIVPALDAGDILSQAGTVITDQDDARTLHDRLAQLGADLLVRTIPDYVNGLIQPKPQPAEGVVHARKITREDGRVDWTRPAVAIWNQVRGLTPWPGAFTHLPAPPPPTLLKLWKARPDVTSGQPGTVLQADKDGLVVACGVGSLRLLEVQTEGKRRLTAQEFLAGHPLTPGCLLPSTSPDPLLP